MKKTVKTIYVSVIMIDLLSLLFFFPCTGFSNDNYWVPEYPPESNYEIKAKINTADKIINGEEFITFKNTSQEEITILAFNWSISEKSKIKITLNGESLSLLNSKKNEARRNLENQIFDTLLKNHTFEVPSSVVKRQANG